MKHCKSVNQFSFKDTHEIDASQFFKNVNIIQSKSLIKIITVVSVRDTYILNN